MRGPGREYDPVVITDEGALKGIVTVRELIERLLELHESEVCAQDV